MIVTHKLANPEILVNYLKATYANNKDVANQLNVKYHQHNGTAIYHCHRRSQGVHRVHVHPPGWRKNFLEHNL